jgi:hypothetical protein
MLKAITLTSSVSSRAESQACIRSRRARSKRLTDQPANTSTRKVNACYASPPANMHRIDQINLLPRPPA